ncbi:MAG TPA: DinB family protein [Blastocatellia bacterium]|nr:DinB family protein [Blastocatellia bacterium]
MLQDLINHKGHANAALLKNIRNHETAARDAELRQMLHHILVANRFWLSLCLGLPFAVDEESRVPESLDEIVDRYRETHSREIEWVSQIRESDLNRAVETAFIPGHSYSVGQGLMQVCMHSHGHRAQCATRVRELGGTPPSMDFILWLKERPAANWE